MEVFTILILLRFGYSLKGRVVLTQDLTSQFSMILFGLPSPYLLYLAIILLMEVPFAQSNAVHSHYWIVMWNSWLVVVLKIIREK